MKTSYTGLRTLLEPQLGVGPLTYLGATVTKTTGSRGLLQLYRTWTESNVQYGEFRLAVALVSDSIPDAIDDLTAALSGLRSVFNGGINQSCLLGTGGIAELKETVVSDFEGLSNNATQSTLSAVKTVIGAIIIVRGLA